MIVPGAAVGVRMRVDVAAVAVAVLVGVAGAALREAAVFAGDLPPTAPAEPEDRKCVKRAS
jgi:hypothetical protein